MSAAIKLKIAELIFERDEMAIQYNEEIALLESELQECGIKVVSNIPNDVGVKAYNFLRENVGIKYSSTEIMKSIKSIGAYAGIVLKPFIEDTRVRTEGEYKFKRYFVPA